MTLARAIYSSAEILLLDDVLAALDVHTGTWVVEKLFKGDLVKGRTIIMIVMSFSSYWRLLMRLLQTHNVAMMAQVADYVVSIGLDGRTLSHGAVNEVLRMDVAQSSKDEEAELIEDNPAIDGGAEEKVEAKTDGKLIVSEEVALGRVSWSARKYARIISWLLTDNVVVALFLGSLGGPFFWLAFLSGMFLADLLTVIETYWLGYVLWKYRSCPF